MSLLNHHVADDNLLFLMIFAEDGGTKDDLKLPGFPEGFDDQLKSEFEAGKTLVVTVMSAMGHDQVQGETSQLISGIITAYISVHCVKWRAACSVYV
jgi:Eukaryotic elongation factor 5A hypusine, DNA-binding OB fold